MTVLALAFAMGFVAGLRSMTPPAVIAWAAHLRWFHLQSQALAWINAGAAVIVFSLLACGEMIADKMSSVPKRTAFAPLLARILTGAFCGACLCDAGSRSMAAGVALGAIGAIAGAFAGYALRARLPQTLHSSDRPVAVAEDLVAVGLAIFIASR